MVQARELRELDDDELEQRLAEYRRELLNLRFQLATGQLDDAARVGAVRKDVARVLTVLRDRHIGAAEAHAAATAPARADIGVIAGPAEGTEDAAAPPEPADGDEEE
jgi:large subunit ribosomal protein L29